MHDDPASNQGKASVLRMTLRIQVANGKTTALLHNIGSVYVNSREQSPLSRLKYLAQYNAQLRLSDPPQFSYQTCHMDYLVLYISWVCQIHPSNL